MIYRDHFKKNWGFYATFIPISVAIFLALIKEELIQFSWLIVSIIVMFEIVVILIVSFVSYKIFILKEAKKENSEILEKIENSEKYELTKQIKVLNEQVSKLKNKKEQVYNRFEDIIANGKKEFTTITIDYDPFFYMDRHNNKTGIGFDILEEIFSPFPEIKFKQFVNHKTPHYNWSTILETYNDRKNNIDFILTPMYETRRRLYDFDVIYSNPLFYSSIGLYMRKDDFNLRDRNSFPQEKINFSIVDDFLIRKRFNDLKFRYLIGELSEVLYNKVTNTVSERSPESTFKDEHYASMLIDINDPDTESDIVFMEVFKAESIIRNNKLNNLVNILEDNSLIYPVGFVFRKEETVLRNFVNLRITELRMSGTIQKIINVNALEYGLKNQSEINRAFIQKYDFAKLDPNFNNSEILFSENIKNEYNLLEKIYGNYVSFQENITDLIKTFRPDEKLNVLEIGYGTGITTEILVNSLSKDNVITILDNDKDMEKILKENRNFSDANITYITSDIIRYLEDYNGEPIDLIVSAYTIHNLPVECRIKLYGLLYKTMSNNSLFINADKYAHNHLNERIDALNYRISKYTDYLKVNPEKNGIIEEWVAHYIKDQSSEFVMIKENAVKHMRDSGFLEDNIKVFVPNDIQEIEMMAILTARKN